jgi:release factor glutamine methyltransferase
MLGVPTARDMIDEAEDLLKASDAIDHPHAGKERVDAEDLMTFVLGDEWSDDHVLDVARARRFRSLVRRRAAGLPPAYITGRTEFHGLDLDVGRGAFIPRQSSEFMADQAIRRLRRRSGPVHVDLATGVGPVALAVANAVPRASVFGADISAKPIALARRNASRLGIRNATFVRGDLFAPLPKEVRGAVDVVTVHPPYVPRAEVRDLPHEVKAFEPRESLTDFSRDGMGLLSRVVREGPEWLRRGGWLLVEVSPDRARDVSTALRRGGFREVRSTKGPIPVSRVIVGRA